MLQMSKERPTKLELHRLKHHWLGGKLEPLQMSSLEKEEKLLIIEDVMFRMHVQGQTDVYKAYAETLADWGVACPHVSFSDKKRGVRQWRICNCCGLDLIGGSC